MKYKFYKIILPLIVFVFIPHIIFGAEFIFSPEIKNINVNDEFKINLIIDTKGENANAFEGVLVYPKDLLDVKEINDGNSIINFWIKKPSNIDKGVIFSGVTPGGYAGDGGQIFSVIFIAKKSGSGDLKIEDGKLLKNDGEGSFISINLSSIKFLIGDKPSKTKTVILQTNDVNPPESFNPQIYTDPDLFDGKWLLAFSANDKGTGINKYEVKESRYSIFNFSKWTETESPYILKDQDLKSYIFVKAIDKAGNEIIVKLSPRNQIASYANPENWIIGALITLVVTIYLFFSNKYKK